MISEPPPTLSAEPARQAPSAARAESCAGDVPRQVDPTDRYMLHLERLTTLGMALTEDLIADAREAIAARRAARAANLAVEPAPASAPAVEPAAAEPSPEELAARDPSGLAFARMTRALRLCMALAIRFHNDRQDRENGTGKARAAARQRAADQVERRVKDIIATEVEPAERDEAKRLLRECLMEKDAEIDLLAVPLEDMAERICSEIGLWTETDDPTEEPPPHSTQRVYDHPDNPDIVIFERRFADPPRWGRRRKPPSG